MEGLRRTKDQTCFDRWARRILVALCTIGLVGCEKAPGPAAPEDTSTGLKLGVLFDYSGALGESGPEAENGVRLAVAHVNSGGGVLGQPVSIEVADGATRPEVAVEEARKLVTKGGVHAIVGPFGSAAALVVAERVSGQDAVPTISPSATSPVLTDVEDAGFFFRTTLSDAAQGPVLARLATDEGFERVALLYRDDVYGRGLQAAFAQAYSGEVTASVAIEPEQETYLEALNEAAAGGPQALVAIAFPYEATIFIREALEEELFDRFLFGDALAARDFINDVGAEALEGVKGTGPAAPPPTNPSTQAVLTSYTQTYGGPPLRGPVFQAYDAAICLCLAAEHAGSLAGHAIRDALPQVCGGDGEPFSAGAKPIASALAALRGSQEVNYEGAATSVDFNAVGDLLAGQVAVWQIQGGTATPIEWILFQLEG